MHENVPVPRGGLGLSHRARDAIGHVRHQRIAGNRWAGWPMAGHEDGPPMMIAAPVIDLLDRTPTRQYGTERGHLVEQVAGRPGRPREVSVPLVQPAETVATW